MCLFICPQKYSTKNQLKTNKCKNNILRIPVFSLKNTAKKNESYSLKKIVRTVRSQTPGVFKILHVTYSSEDIFI